MIIPYQQLSSEALKGLIDEYCLREWGLNEHESPLGHRQERVKQAVENGKLIVVYSEHFETATLVSAEELGSVIPHDQP